MSPTIGFNWPPDSIVNRYILRRGGWANDPKQRSQLLLEALPACHGSRVHRLAYLRDARRANGPFGFVEPQTCRIPGQPDMIQHAPRLTLRIGNVVFIACIQYPARRQNAHPVLDPSRVAQ